MVDAKDKRILLALLKNARLPISRLAKETQLSREIVQYRMQKLERQGIIKAYLARIDQSLFCSGVATMLCKLVNYDRQRFDEMERFLADHREVNWAAELCGIADLAITFLYKDTQDLAGIVASITDFLGKNLKEHQLSLYIDEYKFDRSGLIDKKAAVIHRPTSFTNHRLLALDTDDKIILAALANDCRTPNTAIAKHTSITEDMVRLRIKKYERDGLIKGYTIAIDPQAMGLETYYMGLQFEQMDGKTTAKIQEYVRAHPWVLFCARTAGKYNIVISLATRDRLHFKEVLQGFKDVFQSELVDYEFHLLLQDIKEIFLPKGFLTG